MKKSFLWVPVLALGLGVGAPTILNMQAEASNGCEATDTATLQTCLTTTGGVVNVMNDIALDNAINVSTTSTLDLNGHKIVANYTNSDYMFGMMRGANLTLTDSVGNGLLSTKDYGNVYTVFKMTISGEDKQGDATNLTINGGTVSGTYYAISGNGTRHNTNITVNGGTLQTTDQDSVGIFNPQQGTVTINGGTISGGSGIEMRSGTLTVNGGFIYATSGTYSVVANKSGTTTSGAGIAMAQHSTQLPLSVTINGGEIRGVRSFSEANPQNNPDTALAQVSASINGGVFHGALTSADLKDYVKGGSFDTKPTNVPDGYEAVQNADGTWTVRKKSNNNNNDNTTPSNNATTAPKTPDDGIFGELPSIVENGLLGFAIIALIVATIGLISDYRKNHGSKTVHQDK